MPHQVFPIRFVENSFSLDHQEDSKILSVRAVSDSTYYEIIEGHVCIFTNIVPR